MTVLILRASNANEFELQNYAPLAKKFDISVITSHHPLTPVSTPSISLWSPTDLPAFPYRRQILNRLIGGEQWLLGLEALVNHYHDSNHGSVMLHTAETYTPYTHQAVQLRRQGRVSKLICTCWETIPHANEKFARLRQWKRDAYRYVDVFHTPTKRAKDALVAEGVDPKKVVVIPYGVDLTHFCPISNRKQRAIRRKPVVLTVARPVPEKGIDIVNALKKQMASVADFCLVSGVPYRDMPAVYQSADVFLLPSRTTPTWEEQYGMAIVEAMACGLPIVATNTGAISEVVGNAGILVSPDHIPGMQSAIRAALEHRVSFSRRALARARVLHDASKVAKKLATLYTT